MSIAFSSTSSMAASLSESRRNCRPDGAHKTPLVLALEISPPEKFCDDHKGMELSVLAD